MYLFIVECRKFVGSLSSLGKQISVVLASPL